MMMNKMVTTQQRKSLSPEEKEEKRLRKWVKAGLIENNVRFDKDDFEWEYDKVIEKLDHYTMKYPNEEINSDIINGIVFELLDEGHFELDENE